MRNLKVQANRLQTDDVAKDMKNEQLNILYIHINKLSEEIIARLSELAERKIGQLTFYFAQEKLGKFQKEVSEFERFIESNQFKEKRNQMISHKQLPEKWSDHRHIHIPYASIVKGIVIALRLMKKIDRVTLGPSAPYLWREMRKRRYDVISPPRAGYMLLPYLRLSEKDRSKIIFQEMQEGKAVWVDMETKIDGVEVTVRACKDWGALLFDNRMMVLPEYPLQEISHITTGNATKADDKKPKA